MDFRYFRLLVALVLTEGIWSLPMGCRYNGTSYEEGESMQTVEPCLSCVCRKGGLACSLRVCADYLETLPAGCFLVHKPDDCCPQLLCEGGLNPNGIELRTATETRKKVDGNGCVINETIYGEGSAVASRDPCEYCYCAEGRLRCVRPRCAQAFEGCKAVHEEFSCCPTRFDCRGARVSFVTSKMKHLGNANSKTPAESVQTFTEIDSDFDDKHPKTRQNDDSSAESAEKTTEDFVGSTTEETWTKGTTLEAQPETTTSLSDDNPTTLGFQAGEIENLENQSPTEEATQGATADVLPASEVKHGNKDDAENEGKEASEGASRNSVDATEGVDNQWNSTQIADDYEAYDYGEPELPPSLPNLVIFPFVAADAVVKDERADLYEEVQIKRIDDRPLAFKDFFSPPTKTEGGFVPKPPLFDSFYKLPFSMKEFAASSIEGKERTSQSNIQLRPLDEYNSSLGENRKTDILNVSLKIPEYSAPLEKGTDADMSTEFIIKSQQTKKPVTVTYKNVIVDFYPDHLVKTTRSHSTTRPPGNLVTEKSEGPRHTNSTSPVSENILSESVSGIFSKTIALCTPTIEQEHLAQEISPTVSTITIKESSFFDDFFKTFFTDTNTSTMTALSTTAKRKYSSKTKSHTNMMVKSKEKDATTKTDSEDVDTVTSPTNVYSFSSVSLGTERPFPLEAVVARGPQLADKEAEGAARVSEEVLTRKPSGTNSHVGTLLKLAGCNIYGMMYRIGKVIAELSGPCMECLCTDLGVQCTSLQC